MNMWMVGYNEGGEFNMADYAFNGRKLRPLMPRPVTSTSTSPNNNNNNNTSTPTSNPPCLTRNDFFSQYHNLASTVGVGDQSKRELNNPPVVVSSRWNPTPEQLRALEELYRRGTRTPSAEQIQQITAQLRRFGKIEGKNVFYWFQNHKARERQKRRRQMESASDHQPHEFPDATLVEKKDLGAGGRTVFEVEQQTKNWHQLSTNSTTLQDQESLSIQRATKAAGSEFTTDGWLQFDEGELQQRKNFMERNATWHMMQLTCPTPTTTTLAPHLINTHPNYYINNSNSNSMATTTVSTTRLMDPKLIKTTHHHDLGLFISPHHHHQTHRENGFFHLSSMISSTHQDDGVESQTLQLFPIRNGVDDGYCSDHTTNQYKETEISASAMNAPSHFIEFLPLKN